MTLLSVCNICLYKLYHKNCTETPEGTKYIIGSRAVCAARRPIAFARNNIRAIGLFAVPLPKLAQISLSHGLSQSAIKLYRIKTWTFLLSIFFDVKTVEVRIVALCDRYR
ncbi:hypothetical protein [Microcoleus sp. bin38.metabat.b11b12b14.051]|uniref:hypothetical protein n=1 Tax=Microcoleus sp. bin38.metabat.b11b12b14.051 TaxID=2742709 RepID=UPI0025F5F93A|nr:hypothetical protein [Microcoleus sp. bin38.metabat.b11b12b14.051]